MIEACAHPTAILFLTNRTPGMDSATAVARFTS
ncbi:hypothetical protein J2W52_002681 [Rhizobium miluonense]|uniref:Uncharacterized protein n=1 Tax=Rhizobium miluonense TaxID=411945 RepID=A0ABU1SQ15_9HYPH|nr:hypothetical protein [Rhizobium miluonense]